MSLWRAEEVLAATGGRGPGGWEASDVSIDSRNLAPGALFVALPGSRHDGHAFVADAFARGAAAALVARDVGAPGPCVRVPDTLGALRALAVAARDRSRAVRIGITGSVGKTGTKEALARLLARFGRVHASLASHNNHIGVPLTLARLPREADFAVLEMGMNHAGELAELAALARPQVALVTWVAAAHIGHFADERGIAEAKAEIFAHGPEVAVVPATSPHAALLESRARAAGADVLRFGIDAGEVRALSVESDHRGSRLRAHTPQGVVEARIAIAGRHWVHNALAVLAVCCALGVEVREAAAGLAGLRPPPGRGRRLHLAMPAGRCLLLDEAYNANPASMRAALELLALIPGRRRLAVLGAMAELGRHAPELHAALAEPVRQAAIARVFTVGDDMHHLRARLDPAVLGPHADSAAELEGVLEAELREGDVVLVKGSHACGLVALVESLRTRYGAGED